SRVWADSTRAFVDQPEDVLMDEGATGRLHWSVNFIPENNDTYWLTGGDLPEGEAVKIYTMFHYEIGDELRFAENLREMDIVVEETWISDKPYRIRFRDELGTEHFSDPFYVKYAPKAFVLQPQTVFIPMDDPDAKVPITWAVNFTPDSPQLFRVFNQNLFAWVDEYFTDRAGNPAYSRKTMEVMADASMISEDDYWINFYDVEADHWAYQSAHFYIYPEGIGLLTEQPQDVFIVDGQPAPLTWSVDFTPSNWIDDWGYEEDVFLFDDGNVPSGYLYAPDDMYHYLSGMNVDVSPQQDMTLMAQPEWVSSNPYRLIIKQKDCPRVYSDYFYIRAAHTVKFVPNEYGLGIPDQIVVDGECAVEPELAATREGYTFRGWYKDAAFTERYDFATPVEEALTLYAKWDINYYRVEFDACGGSPTPPPVLTPYWDTVSEPEAPAREGGVFCGWYTDPEYNNVYDFSRHVTGPLTLYAKWDIPIYTVYFQNKGIGTKPPVQKVVYGETAARPEDPSQDGYIFGGWWIDGAEYDFAAPVKRNLTLWAKWTKQCTITFDAGGGSGTMAPVTALQGDSYIAPECTFTPPANKRFVYWSVSTDLYYKHPGQQVSISDDTVFTAVWDYVPTRSVTFNMNGHGEQIPPVWVELNTALAEPPEAPSEEGWTFTGWYTTKSAADSASSAYLYDFSKPVTNNVTLYAGWQDNTLYKIRLSYGGSGYGHAVLTGEGIEQLDDETYLAHPGIWVEVAATPAEGSRTGEDVWGSNWIEANNQPIGGTKRFRMTAAETYVTVSFTMKPIEEGGHLHDATTLTHVVERPATCTVDGCIEHYECPVCGQWFYFDDFYQEFRSVFSVEYYTEHATGHVPADPVQENIDPATCEGDGFCDVVIYCSVCGEELEREFTDIPATGHAWSEPVYEWAADYASLTATHTCAHDP
nr:InlB B-repeat-containing protein [Clostridia bacterium]